MATILITARGEYAVISEDHCAVAFNNLKEAIANCGYRGLKFAFGWEV